MQNYQLLLKELEKYVMAYYREHYKKVLYFHNSVHTQQVVDAAKKIADHYHVNEEEYFIIITAAWFHDIGYCKQANGNNHESISAALASAYLNTLNINGEVITKIENCILATKLPQNPNNILEAIACDADLFHFGIKEFYDFNKLLRKEFKEARDIKQPKALWYRESISLLKEHTYHTDYVRLLHNENKEANIKKLERKLNTLSEEGTPFTKIVQQTTEKTKNVGKANNDTKRPERGVETVFRVTSSNNQQLSSQADNKASIMITVNAIIISVLLSVLLGKVEENPNLLIPTIFLLITNVGTIIFAILATRPSLPKGVLNDSDMQSKNVNLLFFGNFYNTPHHLYKEGMLSLLEDKQFLYGSLIKDVHSQGVVLGRKYKLLRITYNFFMFGLIISIIGFLATMLLTQK